MGCAEIISLSDACASTQWQRLRNELHARFDQWLDRLEEHLSDSKTSLSEVTEAIWNLRQDLTGGLSETLVTQAQVAIEMPYEEAHALLSDLSGVALASQAGSWRGEW